MFPLLRLAVLTLGSALVAAPPAASATLPEERPIISMQLEEARARSLNNWYFESEHWALSGIVLCSYGELWHPVGTEPLVAALAGKQPELQAFALEALLATGPEHLPRVMTAELVEVLINKGLSYKHDHLQLGARNVLIKGLPGVSHEKQAGYKRWWRETKSTWKPPTWILPPPPDQLPEGDSKAGSFLRRAFDLNTAGMEIAIVIDTTGSMQTTIDASAVALVDITSIMEGIAPKLRIGLVEYKDTSDFKKGARIIEKMTQKVDGVRKRLGRLTASGGGDIPESVLSGLQVALDEDMGWQREANKLVVVIGDAPSHDRDQKQLEELATEANRSPFGADASEIIEVDGGGESKAKRGVRPFVISAIGVGADGVPTQTATSLRALATAGGGAYAEVLTADASSADSSSTRIVKHILTLAFGSRWQSQLDSFLTIYLRYRDAGVFQ